MNVQVSSSFKKMTGKAVFAIILFIITYIILLSLAIGMTVLCVMGGIAFIAAKPMAITIGLGVGLASLGFFILVFLFKFLFKQHKVDRSHLVEISELEEPKLFSFIKEVVNEVQTDFPKRVYLSGDVNACVFYDSNFWSMIFPIRKNLQIGLGLVNTISEQEFKAILAHEFGHFSQRSMKVGSYVYNVNQVIFNMLYDNESFDSMIQKWANISGYFSIFVSIAVKIIQGIQWVLKKMYAFINIRYMALSREMEFHADEIAANVAGYLPLKESLLRMDLADHSYNAVLGYYDAKIPDNIKSENIYKEQGFVMNFLAAQNNLSFKNNLPIVSELDLSKYNKSKLTFKNQWASHPTIEERIRALELTNIHKTEVEKPAILLFENEEKIQEEITEKMFSTVTYAENTTSLDFEKFKADYSQTFNKNSFPTEYNSYYDNKNPIEFDVNNIVDFNVSETMDMLFCKEKIDTVYDFIAFENDKNLLINIANKEYDIKSFDYDGQKYKSTEAQNLIPKIETEQNSIRERIKEHDLKIYKFFYNEALKKGNATILKEKYINFFKQDSEYDNKVALYNNISEVTGFISVVTPFEQIRENLKVLLPLELKLKMEIKRLLKDETLRNEISQQTIGNFENYLSKEWEYFNGEEYCNDNLQILFSATNDYNYLSSRKYFITKLDLLNYQIGQLEK
ncbi:M48 family metalloprotease [Pedobacter sp. UBA4863]|uniref:M48 family metalloprotease n=1 Tax=Pedobacter sp. UBA4863 TaxID=1947060 RepID=UPI0025CE7F47|nr:M48 family metallopeptidase [Pedobacter sp. UBA4863]